MGSRAIGATSGEVSMTLWLVSLIITLYMVKSLWGMFMQVAATNPGLGNEFMFLIMLLIVACAFGFMGMFWTNYLVSKYNLNLFIDRITNPEFIGWLRFTRTKKFRPQIVKSGPLGQMKGFANGGKADIINDGSYTVTLPNGNQAVIKCDLSSTNINMDRVRNWNLIKKHFGVVGFQAWEKCADDDKTLFKVTDIDEEEDAVGEIQFS